MPAPPSPGPFPRMATRQDTKESFVRRGPKKHRVRMLAEVGDGDGGGGFDDFGGRMGFQVETRWCCTSDCLLRCL